jgi:hypothetical protein
VALLDISPPAGTLEHVNQQMVKEDQPNHQKLSIEKGISSY